MFAPHTKHAYKPRRPVTRIALLFCSRWCSFLTGNTPKDLHGLLQRHLYCFIYPADRGSIFLAKRRETCSKLHGVSSLKLLQSPLWEPRITTVHEVKSISEGQFYWGVVCLVFCVRPPLWSSSQSIWTLTQRTRVRFPALPDFLSLERVPLSPCESKWGATWKKSSGSGLENWD
jgi:hypothetical protein